MCSNYFETAIIDYDIRCPLCKRDDKCEDFIQCANCYETICESCYPENGIDVCQVCTDLDKITDDLSNTSIFDMNEYEELKNNVNLEIINMDVLNKTKQRYERYINRIRVWEINETCCLYIKDAVLLFLSSYHESIYKESIYEESIYKESIYKESTLKLINLRKTIDVEIISLINSV